MYIQPAYQGSNVYSASIPRKKSAQPKCTSCMNHIWAIALSGQTRFTPARFADYQTKKGKNKKSQEAKARWGRKIWQFVLRPQITPNHPNPRFSQKTRHCTQIQRKTKGQQLKGKIVSAFSHFFALFHTFHTFQDFSTRIFLKIKASLKENKWKRPNHIAR